MDLDIDSSVLSSLIHLDSKEESKRGTKASATWAHTRLLCGEEAKSNKGAQIRYCTHCIGPPYSTSVTTNMRNHLRVKHQILIDKTPSAIQQATLDQLQRLYNQAASIGQT